ncbi:MAG: hypothetical protein EBT04_06885 [Betaproteobacteria bacterium]|nr:hypothetical protein [Betaproteobacteria bacterium]
MMPPREEPLRDLLANAYVLAESLENDRRPQAAALVRGLIDRVVPTKVVRSGGSHPKKIVPEALEPIRQTKRGTWCDQCDRIVLKGCTSRFCKVTA